MSFCLYKSDEKEPNKVVEILDSMMGSGKTSGIIGWIESHPNEKYIYVSPLLTEVEDGGRLHQNLKTVAFESPKNTDSTKAEDMLRLLKDGANISCTHSLYLGMTQEHFKYIQSNNYIVIIDEEIDVIGGFTYYSRSDLDWLVDQKVITVCPKDGMVTWVGDRSKIDDKHKYKLFISYSDAKALYASKRSEGMMVTQLPVKLFESAKRVIILTYMFKGNILDSFLQLKGFEVKDFTEVAVDYVSKDLMRSLITLVEPNKGMRSLGLSSSWYKSEKANRKNLAVVSNYIRYVAKQSGLESKYVAWCVPKYRVERPKGSKTILVKPSGFIEDSHKIGCFLSATTRATNKYRHKQLMIHCYDRYPQVTVSAYLEDYGYPIDRQIFALSELLQWVWRGCIRDKEPMTVAIGSSRMYNLFKYWLEEEN